MDKHDLMILDIVQQHKKELQEHIRLSALERNFWKRIEGDVTLSVGQARIGERITRLYLDGMIQNKSGYMLTKKGREALNLESERIAQLVFARFEAPRVVEAEVLSETERGEHGFGSTGTE